jgi:hypothetical protein
VFSANSPVVFKPPDKFVILSGAPHRFIAWHSACGAESKDLGGSQFTHAARSFSTPKARQQALDVGAGNSKIQQALGSQPQGKTVPGPVVEKLSGYAQDRLFGSAPPALCHAINL